MARLINRDTGDITKMNQSYKLQEEGKRKQLYVEYGKRIGMFTKN